jgi:heat shock protein HslJ
MKINPNLLLLILLILLALFLAACQSAGNALQESGRASSEGPTGEPAPTKPLTTDTTAGQDDALGKNSSQYVTIETPTEGARLDASQPIIVSGRGGTLFEGTVVVQALDAAGNELALQPTIIQSPEAGTGGEGIWQIELNLTVDGETPGKILAFATSPKDGSIVASDEVPVSFFSDKAQAAPLENTIWQLTGLADGELNAALAIHQVTATFDPVELRISGNAGCNRYFSSYKLDGEQLVIPEAVASTRRMCAEPQAAIEKAFLSMLKQVACYQIKADNTLNLLDAQGNALLVFQVDSYSTTDSFTREELANAAYLSEWTDQGTVQLNNGEYRAAAEQIVTLTNFAAFGDLDGDGQDEAAVILVTNTGGSGSFYDLAIVRKQSGALTNLATTLLGDRVQIKSLRIENGKISVDLLTQGPDDAMCCPTQYVINQYALQNGELVQTGSETVE